MPAACCLHITLDDTPSTVNVFFASVTARARALAAPTTEATARHIDAAVVVCPAGKAFARSIPAAAAPMPAACRLHVALSETFSTVNVFFASVTAPSYVLLLRIHELVEIFFRNASSVIIPARNFFECRPIWSSRLVELAWSDASIAICVRG